jgi:hypothetical protein
MSRISYMFTQPRKYNRIGKAVQKSLLKPNSLMAVYTKYGDNFNIKEE